MDKSIFRDVMAQFAASVTVITTDGAGGKIGVTASSVTSVCDEPPLVLVCLHLSGRANKAIRSNGVFCINLLAPSQVGLAKAFSGHGQLSMEERFALAPWNSLRTGAPVSADAMAVLDCTLEDEQIIGTHAVLFGRVVAVGRGPAGPPLLYAERAYRPLARWCEGDEAEASRPDASKIL